VILWTYVSSFLAFGSNLLKFLKFGSLICLLPCEIILSCSHSPPSGRIFRSYKHYPFSKGSIKNRSMDWTPLLKDMQPFYLFGYFLLIALAGHVGTWEAAVHVWCWPLQPRVIDGSAQALPLAVLDGTQCNSERTIVLEKWSLHFPLGTKAPNAGRYTCNDYLTLSESYPASCLRKCFLG
jgi:hypothetical protein